VVFANGEILDAEFIRGQLQGDDFLIAADGGNLHLRSMDLIPHLLIGDLDSIDDDLREEMQKSGVEIKCYKREKNETDLELAVFEALQRGFEKMLIVAALGGRLDQTLGNLSLAFHPDLNNCEIKMDDGVNVVYFPREVVNISGQPGDSISLIAFGEPVRKINVTGFKYPLVNETLWPYQTRGISNEMLSSVGRIEFESGKLFVIQMRKKK